MDWRTGKAGKALTGELRVQSDKSISHRAVMFGAIAGGELRVNNFLFSEDCISTLNAFREMGISIEEKERELIIKGKGLKGLHPPGKDLYLGNSGTTMRIISGILSGQDFPVVLTGDESLSKRPMDRIINPLSLMGAGIHAMEGGRYAPLKISPSGKKLNPVEYNMPVASAQVKSCVLSAGLYADGTTSVVEPFKSRDHTERMLKYFSADISTENLKVTVKGGRELTPRDIDVPGDISSAAFFIVGALIVKGSHIVLKDLGLNPTRTGLIAVLKRMGADITISDMKEGVEPSGTVEVRYSGLTSTVIEEKEMPLMIDEVPVFIIAALMAEGTTVIKGIRELKVKETDRVQTMKENLALMGIGMEEDGDALFIKGGQTRFSPAVFNSYGDHRIAMSMAIASLLSEGECTVKNTGCVETSYPGFLDDLKKVIS